MGLGVALESIKGLTLVKPEGRASENVVAERVGPVQQRLKSEKTSVWMAHEDATIWFSSVSAIDEGENVTLKKV